MSRIDQIQQLLKEQPNDSFMKHALALEYVKINDDTRAKKVFEELLLEDPNYVGSYYHLAKLYERTGLEEQAINTYERGMEIAKSANDMHAYGELKSAHENLAY